MIFCVAIKLLMTQHHCYKDINICNSYEKKTHLDMSCVGVNIFEFQDVTTYDFLKKYRVQFIVRKNPQPH